MKGTLRRENLVIFELLVLIGFFAAPLDLWATGACEVVTLAQSQTLAVGGDTRGVAVGDFNGDSNKDIVVGNASGNTVFLYLGNGQSNFTFGGSFVAGGFPHAIKSRDFNRDGKPDLVVPNENTVSILLNDGLGGFLPPRTFTIDFFINAVGVGDFNNDQNLDLAVVNAPGGQITILIGDGGGGFAPGNSFPAGNLSVSAAVGDFDGDGNLDLAVSNYDPASIVVFLGDGTGQFTELNSYPLAGNGSEIVAADFNNDGHLDLVVGAYNQTPSNIEIFLGQGDGGFAPGAEVIVDDDQGLAVADFNSDGNLDVIAATYEFNSLQVALGDGTGNFLAAQTISLKPGRHFATDVAIGDFNHDGKPDVATANSLTNDASVLLNLPTVAITPLDPAASETGPDPGVFKIARNGCTDKPLLVYYMVSGTATPGSDYKRLLGQLPIPAGKAAANLKILPVDDTLPEDPETVIVTLSTSNNYAVGPKSSATVTISDND